MNNLTAKPVGVNLAVLVGLDIEAKMRGFTALPQPMTSRRSETETVRFASPFCLPDLTSPRGPLK